MATALKPLDGKDRFNVNIYDHDSVEYWRERFSCTTPELRDAVAAVGTSAVALRHYISNRQTLGARTLPSAIVERLHRHGSIGGRPKV